MRAQWMAAELSPCLPEVRRADSLGELQAADAEAVRSVVEGGEAMTAYERAMRFLAGHGELIAQSWFDYEGFLDELAAEIRAAVDEEREGCAKVMDVLAAQRGEPDAWRQGYRNAAHSGAAAIRARGET